ncbi:MAG: polysaccharide biosynthesis/export family protein [Ferruginibacter sp.]|nr:polysaccharide biosynthesis/export family protein [Ferruginibacter sp.]
MPISQRQIPTQPFLSNCWVARFLFCFLILSSVVQMMSCTSSKSVIYLNNLNDTTPSTIREAKNEFDNAIQKNDQLWITVGGSNPLDLIALNSANGIVPGGGSTGGTSSSSSMIGYLVESDGKIKIPYVGKVQAEGLSRLQLENALTDLFKDYTKNPVVNVRFLNYSFSVLGEVRNSGRFPMANERTTILEAISLAGDLTDLGKADNVLVVREVNGTRNLARINLLSKDLFNSPYYYLKTNDVVYVEPVKAKFIARTGIPQYLSIVAVGLSLLITIINLNK